MLTCFNIVMNCLFKIAASLPLITNADEGSSESADDSQQIRGPPWRSVEDALKWRRKQLFSCYETVVPRGERGISYRDCLWFYGRKFVSD